VSAQLAADPEATAILNSAGGPGAGAWLQLPVRPAHHFTDAQFAVACRLRIGADVPTGAGTCGHTRPDGSRCGAALDPKGRHALHCPVGGWLVRRHDALCCVACDYAEHAGAEVDREVIVPTASNIQVASRLDLIVQPPLSTAGQAMPRQYCDVAVASCLSIEARRNGRSSRVAGAAADLLEAHKRREYPHLASSGLVPLVCETHGRLGSSLSAWLRSLAPPPGDGLRGPTLSAVYQTWSATLQRANAKAILAAAGTPTAAGGS
jgi:hypothetical protein